MSCCKMESHVCFLFWSHFLASLEVVCSSDAYAALSPSKQGKYNNSFVYWSIHCWWKKCLSFMVGHACWSLGWKPFVLALNMVKGTEDGKNKVGLIAAELCVFIALFFPINWPKWKWKMFFSNVVSKSARRFLKFHVLGNECTQKPWSQSFFCDISSLQFHNEK